jgi:hypothetical protein
MNAKFAKIAIVAAGMLAAVATQASAATPYEIGGANNSMSRFGGDGYVYFHEDRPASSTSLPPFRVTNPKGLDEAAYAGYSSEDPEWQPKVVINKATPAADPIARPTTLAQKKAFFRIEDGYLQSQSTP